MPARALMIQGTGSDVGKSLIVAGLARAFTRRGLKVRPFKPQNMSNNAAVTADGGEIGRAQALQARARRRAAQRAHEPGAAEAAKRDRLAGRGAGQGRRQRPRARIPGDEAQAAAAPCWRVSAGWPPKPISCWSKARASASEVNLRAADIANMGFARAADVPVMLLGDIDRGGVIASLVGTKAVIDPADAAMIVGFIVNRFRGDPSLFADGMKVVAEHTGWRALGLVPFFAAAHKLPAEDALGLPTDARQRAREDRRSLPIRASPTSTTSIRCGSSPMSA